MPTDGRRKPGPPGPPCSPKTQVGRDRRDFDQKRQDVNQRGWTIRRDKYGPTGRKPKETP